MNRPPDGDEARTTTVSFRATPEESEWVGARAKQLGFESISDYVRSFLRADSEGEFGD